MATHEQVLEVEIATLRAALHVIGRIARFETTHLTHADRLDAIALIVATLKEDK